MIEGQIESAVSAIHRRAYGRRGEGCSTRPRGRSARDDAARGIARVHRPLAGSSQRPRDGAAQARGRAV